jgi:hypothetical protein
MRILLVFIIFIAFLMNTVKCPGCQKSFDQGLSIKAHQRTCGGLHLVGQKQIKKRIDNTHKREAAKLARLEGHSLDEIAEKRQELRDETDDDSLAFPTDIPPQVPAGPSTVSTEIFRIMFLMTDNLE